MRQKDDVEFAQLLNRLRENNLTNNDLSVLDSRIVNSSEPHYPSTATHILVLVPILSSSNFTQTILGLDVLSFCLFSIIFTTQEAPSTLTVKSYFMSTASVTSSERLAHKSQGCTLHQVVVNLSSRAKKAHIHYVALSRVTSLNGLHILDLNPSKIAVSDSVMEEIERLRTQAVLKLC
jgi:hypothetical protein